VSVGEQYQVVIGLEVHVELATRTKAFCSCPVAFGAPPNTLVCPVCLGLPGALPVVNERAVEYAVRAGLALDCHIAATSLFARKNYFYPDLPKGYQITQYESPLASGGQIEFAAGGEQHRVGITRVHLEEDTGKLVHQPGGGSLVDFNRCGVPLLEIVSEPDIRSAEEARLYLQELRTLLLFTGISDVRMEEGSLRCDANISLRAAGGPPGTLVEVKNMNSFRSVKLALEHEAARQARLLSAGERIVRETRHWDETRGITFSSRSKEEAHDYRYFPEPDLPPLALDPGYVERVRAALPELPAARRERLQRQYGLPPYDAGVLTATPQLGDFFEGCARLHPDAKTVSNWLLGDVLRILNETRREIQDSPLTPAALSRVLGLIDAGTISGRTAKPLLEELVRAGGDPDQLAVKLGLLQISDEAALQATVDEVVRACPEVAADFRAGKEKALTFLVGQVMKRTAGRANPQLVNRLLRERLAGGTPGGGQGGGQGGGRS